MKIIAGVDEVGRGSLIGPVYAAAVILNKSINKKLLKDSKSLTKTKRELLSKYIKKNSIWAIGKSSVKEIEKINILQASLLAMKRAIKKLKKMLQAINIKIEKVYLTYSINFRPPEDRKPTSQEIKRYSIFLKEHISIIGPKIVILMGSTAMEAITGLGSRISNERGKWKEIILKNKTYPLMITFSPSYLIRFPENKKYSWDDLKKIKHKIQDLDINI